MPFFNYTANQMNQRRYARLEDQFGRWWGAQIEKSTGDPCAEVSPVGGWNDPLNTPNIYLRPPKHDDGTTISGRIEVDFDRWMDSIRGSEDDWNQSIQVGKQPKEVVLPLAWNDPAGPWRITFTDLFGRDTEQTVTITVR